MKIECIILAMMILVVIKLLWRRASYNYKNLQMIKDFKSKDNLSL